MITVENLLMAYASAYDAWLDPETERENPTPEYAELIRRVVSAENAELREKCDNQRRELKRFNEITDEDSIEILNLRLKLEAYERVITRIEGQRASLDGFRCAELQTLEWVLRMFREAGWEES